MSARKLAAIMPRRLPRCCFFGLLLMAACANEPPKNKTHLEVRPQAPAPQPKKSSEAPKSQRLPDSPNSRHLMDADTRVQANDLRGAQKALDKINVHILPPDQLSKFRLLEAQIALSKGETERALRKLEAVRPAILFDADQISSYQSLAFVHALSGDVLTSVRDRLKLGRLLQNPQQQQQNIIAILESLSALPPDTLSNTSPITDELSGWMALAKILKQRDQVGVDLAGQIQAWRQTYPGHPANAEFLQSYLRPPVQPDASAEPSSDIVATNQPEGAHIAVLLPSSGAYVQAGKAVKAGLQVAHRLAASAAPQLPLKFYDSEQGDIVGVYKQALAAGAKQVIGPLVKEQLQVLAESGDLPVPVLALNHVENLRKANLYQFGLSPIDDAEQLALKARRDGQQNAVLLTPDTNQGQRIRHYLMSAWQASGGAVVGMESYDPKQHDFAAILKNLLGANANSGGHKPSLALFISASPEQARELAPQLKYQQSSELAVYAMPNVYSGRQNPVRDAELGKVNFCDIPWLFPEAYSGDLSQQALQNTWQGLSDGQIKLVALGVDAFNLLGKLGNLANTPYAGATGRLTLTTDNRIARKLACAQFKGGVPVSTGFAE